MTTGAQAEKEKVLYFYNWTDYYPVELLAKFEADTGIKVTLDGYDSNETLISKLQSGGANYDVIVPSDYMIPGLIKDGLIQKIDTPKMANYQYMKDNFKNPDFDPTQEYSAPYLWGVTGIAYDSAQVPGGELSNRGRSTSNRRRSWRARSPRSIPPATKSLRHRFTLASRNAPRAMTTPSVSLNCSKRRSRS